ncbi:cytochrome bd oxidase small subunit CydS [Paenibacillus sp. SAFN-117]
MDFFLIMIAPPLVIVISIIILFLWGPHLKPKE